MEPHKDNGDGCNRKTNCYSEDGSPRKVSLVPGSSTFAYATFVHSDGIPETFVGDVGKILMVARARACARIASTTF